MGFTIDVGDEIALVKEEWEELAVRADAPPFARPGWLEAWWPSFGRGGLELVQLRDGDELLAFIPLQRHAGRLASPTNWHTPSFAPLSASPEAERELLAAVFRRRESCIEFDFVDCELTLERARRSARAQRRTPHTTATARQPYVALDGTWDDYLSTLSANRRKGLRRNWRRIARCGEITFTVVDGRSGLESLLKAAYAIELRGWKGDAGTAIASQPATLRFYDDVARWAAEQGFLRLAFLHVDGEPIAFDYALEHGGAWYSLKAGYDERFRTYGPGALLLERELEWAYAQGLRRFELLGDSDDFKAYWASHSREIFHLRAISDTIGGRATRLKLAASRTLRGAGRRLSR